MSSPLPPALLAGIQDGLMECDCHLLVVPLPDEKLTSEGFVPKSLRELAADGFLVNYQAFIPPRMVELIDRYRIPAVWINSQQNHDCVHPDDFGGATLLTRALIDLGHRRIAYVDFTHSALAAAHYSAKDRWGGYAATVESAGIQPLRIGPDRDGLPATAVVRRILASPDRPTATVCYSSRESRLVYHVASLLGLQVPEDLSIVRFGAAPFDDLGMEFTVAVIPERAMGREAVRMLRAKIDRPLQPHPPLALPFTLHLGKSVRPISQADSGGISREPTTVTPPPETLDTPKNKEE